MDNRPVPTLPPPPPPPLYPVHEIKLKAKTQSKIIHVDLYTVECAEVSRMCGVKLASGQNRVTLSGLPTALDSDTVRVDFLRDEHVGNTSLAVVQDFTVDTKATSYPTPISSTKLKELESRRSTLQSELTRYRDVQAALPRALHVAGSTTASPPVKNLLGIVGEYEATAAVYDTKARLAFEKIEAVDKAMREERRVLYERDEERRKCDAKVIIDIFAPKEEDVRLVVIYAVRKNVGWSAAYDIRACTAVSPTDDTSIELVYKADVHQNTGEDWTDVPLTLHTSRPTPFTYVRPATVLSPVTLYALDGKLGPPTGAQTPPLLPPPPPPAPIHPPPSRGPSSASSSPLLCGYATTAYDTELPMLTALVPPTGSDGGAFIPDSSSPTLYMPRAFLSVPSLIEEVDEVDEDSTEREDETLKQPETEQAHPLLYLPVNDSNAGNPAALGGASHPLGGRDTYVTSTGEVNATFRLPRPITVPSSPLCGPQHVQRVTVASLTLDAKMSLVTSIASSPYTYMEAEVSNDSKYTFIFGSANVWFDGSLIGRSQVPFTCPRRSFTCILGCDSTVRTELHPFVTSTTTSGGLFKKTLKTTMNSQRLTIHNHKTSPVKNIKVHDCVPTSSDPRVKVKVHSPFVGDMGVSTSLARHVTTSKGVSAKWHLDDDQAVLLGGQGSGRFDWIVDEVGALGTVELVTKWESNAPKDLVVTSSLL